MSGVNAVIGIGVTLITVGIMWMVLDAEFVNIRAMYWISTPYLELMSIGVNVYPTVMILIGIFCSLSGIGMRIRE